MPMIKKKKKKKKKGPSQINKNKRQVKVENIARKIYIQHSAFPFIVMINDDDG
jgi:hypothetical protein